MGHRVAVAFAVSALALVATMAEAQTTVRIGKQYGIAYLPLTLMEHKQGPGRAWAAARPRSQGRMDAVRQWRAHATKRSSPVTWTWHRAASALS